MYEIFKLFVGFARDLILGPTLFNSFINDLDDGTEHTFGKFENMKLEGVVDAEDGCAAIQRDLDRLEKWACGNLVMFNKGKSKGEKKSRTCGGITPGTSTD
ncbi:rna-directed dna polymerase from mobile element jockey-like [Pitangus sulphuratus]|nr:rna-directed dna polymerase from mobile element jockey-like [Pitangus sulphuratus]